MTHPTPEARQAALDVYITQYETDIAYLESIKRTKYGDESLKDSQRILRMLEEIKAEQTALTAHDTVSVTREEWDKIRLSYSALIKYAEWQINEGGNHHPTLGSAINSSKEALSIIDRKGK